MRRLALALGLAFAASVAGADGLPRGGAGIAARHPGDRGIATDPSVIFADDFEAYQNLGDVARFWDAGLYHFISVTADPSLAYAGRHALEFICPRQGAELSNQAGKYLKPEEELLFIRYYSKFDKNFDVTGSSHNGAGASAHYFINGAATPGIKADGKNKFLVFLESWRDDASEANPGRQNLYVYQPEQRSEWGDHIFPDGVILPFSYKPGDFGAGFKARENFVPELGRWYCYELMVKANGPGKRDGRVAWWVDGRLMADHENMRLRDTGALKMDRVDLIMHIKSNPLAETRKWYDNVVVARSYVGPMRPLGR